METQSIKKTGYDGLWKLGKRVNRLALEWKLMEDLSKEGLGTQDIEARAWSKQINREVKKGRGKPDLAKGRYSKIVSRDRKYIEMEIRRKTVEAKK